MINDCADGQITIALVDDSLVTHQVVHRALDGHYHVVSFMSGEEALCGLQRVNPSLVLLDVEMPGLNGFETIRRIRRTPEISTLPVVFLTVRCDVSFEIQALSMGAADYVNKPFAPELLQKRVEIHLAHALQKRMLEHYNESLRNTVHEQVKIIKELEDALIFTLADLVEMRDNSTGEHVARTQDYYNLILGYLSNNNLFETELANVDMNLLSKASQLHDIGKIAISDSILLKPGRLTADEFEIMKTHTIAGYKAITRAMAFTSDTEFLQYAATIAISHHERWDGSGYPNGFSGKSIPLAGRIMAVVDVYDALVSERPYKKKIPHEEAVNIITADSGTHFDPILVQAFLHVEKEFNKIRSNN